MKKGGIRQKTIDSMVSFLNLLKGQKFTARQVNDLAREFNIRSNVHNFAHELNFCVKKGNEYNFADYEFEPIHARQLITLSNEYNHKVVEAKKLRLAEKQKQSEYNEPIFENANEITETIDVFGKAQSNQNEKNQNAMSVNDFFQSIFNGNKNANVELKICKQENELLKSENDNLRFEIKNLQAQISALELQNSLKNNLSNFDEEEIINLRGKVEGFEMLFSYYFN